MRRATHEAASRDDRREANHRTQVGSNSKGLVKIRFKKAVNGYLVYADAVFVGRVFKFLRGWRAITPNGRKLYVSMTTTTAATRENAAKVLVKVAEKAPTP